MKKIAILVASVLVLGGFGTKTFASGTAVQTTEVVQAVQTTQTTQTEQTTQAAQTTDNTQAAQTADTTVSYKEEAGITPDSLLYTIDKAVDQLRILLAGSDEKKAEVIADIAQERLGESEVMTEAGKIELAKKAIEEYNAKITEAAQLLKDVVVNLDAKAAATTDADVEEADSKLEQSISNLEKAIQEAQTKSIVVLDTLKEAAPKEEAKEIEEMKEDQVAHKAVVANFVKERHEFNAAKKSLNMAKVGLKKVEKSGSEADVKAAQEKLASAQKDYVTAQTELHAAFQAKKVADLGLELKKEEAKLEAKLEQTATEQPITAEQNNTAVDQAVTAEKTAAAEESKKAVEAANAPAFIKTNNGNGNGNKSSKVEKEDDKEDKEKKEKEDKAKSAPGKSGEEHGKSNQGNGKKK
jgi:hypothetical protein